MDIKDNEFDKAVLLALANNLNNLPFNSEGQLIGNLKLNVDTSQMNGTLTININPNIKITYKLVQS